MVEKPSQEPFMVRVWLLQGEPSFLEGFVKKGNRLL
jgi:hypothetical protein